MGRGVALLASRLKIFVKGNFKQKNHTTKGHPSSQEDVILHPMGVTKTLRNSTKKTPVYDLCGERRLDVGIVKHSTIKPRGDVYSTSNCSKTGLLTRSAKKISPDRTEPNRNRSGERKISPSPTLKPVLAKCVGVKATRNADNVGKTLN